MNKTKLLVFTTFVILLIAILPLVQGRPDDFFFTIHVITTEPRILMCETLKTEAAKIGINIEIHSMEWAATEELIVNPATYDEGGWDMEISGHLEIQLDPDAMADIYSAKGIAPYGQNYPGYKNAIVDEMLLLGRSAGDPDKRAEYYQRMYREIYEDVPWLCLYTPRAFYLWHTDVQGMEDFGAKRQVVSDPPFQLASVSVSGTDTLVFAEYFFYPNLIPLYWNYLTGVYGTLLRVDKDFNFVPELAESWEISDDATQYTFNLRQDVKWHDGEQFTSEDVKFTFETLLNPDSGSPMHSVIADNIASADDILTPDEYTVIINLKNPNAAFLYHVTRFTAMEIIPEHVLKGVDLTTLKTSEYNTVPGMVPGTGPWKFIELSENHMKWERNDDFYGEPAKMKYLVYQRIPEASTALAALKNKEVHFADFFYHHETEIDSIEADPNLKYTYGDRLDVEGGAFNLNHPILSNKWVRKAITHVFPREDFTENIYPGTPSKLPLPAGHWAEPPEAQPITYDIDLAKSYMEKAGYKFSYLEEAVVETPWTDIAMYFVGGIVLGAVVAAAILMVIRRKE